jgi:hypothetical protein
MAGFTVTITRKNMLLRRQRLSGCRHDDRQNTSDSAPGLLDPGSRKRRHATEIEFRALPSTPGARRTGVRNALAWAVEGARGNPQTVVRQ